MYGWEDEDRSLLRSAGWGGYGFENEDGWKGGLLALARDELALLLADECVRFGPWGTTTGT